MAKRLYRVALTNPATAWDFTSKINRGELPPSDDPEVIYVSTGLSMFDSRERAVKKALRFPDLGSLVVEVTISDDAPIRYEQTFGRGYCTVWGDPATLMSCVTSVYAVNEPEQE